MSSADGSLAAQGHKSLATPYITANRGHNLPDAARIVGGRDAELQGRPGFQRLVVAAVAGDAFLLDHFGPPGIEMRSYFERVYIQRTTVASDLRVAALPPSNGNGTASPSSCGPSVGGGLRDLYSWAKTGCQSMSPVARSNATPVVEPALAVPPSVARAQRQFLPANRHCVPRDTRVAAEPSVEQNRCAVVLNASLIPIFDEDS